MCSMRRVRRYPLLSLLWFLSAMEAAEEVEEVTTAGMEVDAEEEGVIVNSIQRSCCFQVFLV